MLSPCFGSKSPYILLCRLQYFGFEFVNKVIQSNSDVLCTLDQFGMVILTLNKTKFIYCRNLTSKIVKFVFKDIMHSQGDVL